MHNVLLVSDMSMQTSLKRRHFTSLFLSIKLAFTYKTRINLKAKQNIMIRIINKRIIMQINFFKLSLSLPEDKPESNISLEFNETTLIE
jgi:hypothetical protein